MAVLPRFQLTLSVPRAEGGDGLLFARRPPPPPPAAVVASPSSPSLPFLLSSRPPPPPLFASLLVSPDYSLQPTVTGCSAGSDNIVPPKGSKIPPCVSGGVQGAAAARCLSCPSRPLLSRRQFARGWAPRGYTASPGLLFWRTIRRLPTTV
ncbi:hypothetical protein O6H91_03G075600 [Diphasiastrum complanatum]|uniref:Uncharacterized protein n=1 Tax=Diphasiastrum complanatum TaxID=34168 RepID=A0ACC2E7Y3_DIPCM|nr:hypothetical protein O6H91_03G075600 [Diphasiastrum complanatum]